MSESYESVYSRLENIVKDLESDNISLEESISKYEEGLKLFKYCSKILNEYEGKVKVLMQEGTEVEEREFKSGDDLYE
ncbi:exodeoxyribonuclease VII small subunit [Peptoniphilus mikwangii]|uniref:exodeoxyribonuclease VII small subunit n=1 Tax=Peptoniphilus mikwangii TaxID=1354300 RepID=UPI00041EB5A7|nr:exodeoxyribonuclease VII small subunit [Peptoniphilus mikwangii]